MLRRDSQLIKKLILKFIFLLNPKLPVLWGGIGKGVTLSRLSKIHDSRTITLGSDAWIEDNALLAPMGGTIKIGNNTHILSYAMIKGFGGDINIGDHCTIHPFCILHGAGGLQIGGSVRIASHTVIMASNHVFDNPETYMRLQGIKAKGIIIKDDVWLGAGVCVLDSVTIGKGSVIGAGAVVSKDVPDYAIVTGVPGRITGWRKKKKDFESSQLLRNQQPF